ncbi:MAG: hypothetical protein CMM48_12870 [Rhodospirillaceae bacterium]|nr:hypothetical protein [Rhodospirillaceae bacterium]
MNAPARETELEFDDQLVYPEYFVDVAAEQEAPRRFFEWALETHFEQAWEEDSEIDVIEIREERLRLSITKIQYKHKTRTCMLVSFGSHGNFTIRVSVRYDGDQAIEWKIEYLSGDYNFVTRFFTEIWPDYVAPPLPSPFFDYLGRRRLQQKRNPACPGSPIGHRHSRGPGKPRSNG